ncbi:MAG TPA: ABC transporter [Clostridiales bacterium UBA8960]|jgi:putative ABC transport system ATP-binding protein|nr:ABC transporter [Clostridiales bacterium UBA8960]
MEILSIKKLDYTYDDGESPVLTDINLDFKLGQVYAIMGKSGAGKTTLLSLISGLNQYKAGQILYNGNDLKSLDKEHYRSREIGIIFQSFNLLLHLNAVENVMLSINLSKIKVKDKLQHAFEMLNKVELSKEKAHRRVLKLSGGEQQRVAIARALSYNPSIIIADEPTGNLDGETEAQVLKILKNLAHNENKCVIVVTHSEKVANESDVVYRL